jgi:16S rRNA (cytosine967-C5)-methyltransferase
MTAELRAEAARSIARVLAGRNLDDALEATRPGKRSSRDRALVQMLAYGVLREYRLLAQLANSMLQKPLENEAELHALLLTGLYQIRATRIPPHAAVSETVEATALLGKERLRGLVNALLRRYLREREALDAALPAVAAVRHSYPDWLADAIQRDWPENGKQVMAEGNRQGPMSLRVNRRQGSREDYQALLQASGFKATTTEHAADALVLDEATAVEALPGFAAGKVSVQDVSAQLAADLLDLEDGLRVLDACAAPGGKAAHLLERADVELLALDVSASRLARVRENLDRLGLRADLQTLDANRLADRWSGPPFDRILVDAPCSGTGVIRRHPDIKWLRRIEDISRMANEQQYLLKQLWPLLAPGGKLVYATCSILTPEGDDVARRFLMATPDARHEPIAASWGEAQRFGRRIAPGTQYDGFYYCCLRKGRGKSA